MLDILADRKTTGQVTGQVLLNGQPRTRDLIHKSSAYVMQDNVFISALTVYETLYFAALLRLPETWLVEQKNARVQQIMHVLGLNQISKSLVGDEAKRGISGGQKKRLAVGIEIIHLPDIIFLDEPTTGLDSSSAYEVMSIVQGLIHYNRTILCTIHQPSVRTFHLFHSVLLLAAGQVIYSGPIQQVTDYFTSSRFHFLYLAENNPADFIVAVASNMAARQEGLEDDGIVPTVEALVNAFAESALGQALHVAAHQHSLASFQTVAVEDKTGSTVQFSTSTWFQVRVLIHRQLLRKRRESTHLFAIIGRYSGFISFFVPINIC